VADIKLLRNLARGESLMANASLMESFEELHQGWMSRTRTHKSPKM